jgi:hypothetical protein
MNSTENLTYDVFVNDPPPQDGAQECPLPGEHADLAEKL